MHGHVEETTIRWCHKAAWVFLTAGLSATIAIIFAFATRTTLGVNKLDSTSKLAVASPVMPRAMALAPPDSEWALNNPPLAFLVSLTCGDLNEPILATYVPKDWVNTIDASYLANLVGDETPCREVVGSSTGVYHNASTIGFEAERMLMSFSQLGRRYPYGRPNSDANSYEIMTATLEKLSQPTARNGVRIEIPRH